MKEEKSVEFQRGQVSEYNGQSNIFCDFVTVTEGSKQNVYYILNDKKLDNGFYVASTVLKEAIDSQIIRTHLGVIDKDGNIVIPFENKGIIPVEGNYLLAVRSEPQSPSVLEALASRNDPAAAAKMVNTNASIKDALNSKMNDGKFILNDLLSEGTIYTLEEGCQNVLKGNYYSFIGMTRDAFFCSTNVPDSPIVEVPRTDLFADKIIDENIETKDEPVDTANVLSAVLPEVVPSPIVESKDGLDVAAVSVAPEEIDSSFNSENSFSKENPAAVLNTADSVPSSVDDSPVVSTPETDTTLNNDAAHEPNSLVTESGELSVGEGVVRAVSAVVQKGRELKLRVLELEKANQAYQEQLESVEDLRSENNQLKEANAKLTSQNRALRGVLEQIQQELEPVHGAEPSAKTFRIAA